jgi:DNA-binding SARP family transcriptional activator
MARECRVDLLGRFRVVVGGREVSGDAWRNRRAADLVKLLALAPGHRLSRDRVMAALWPELGTAAAGANLRKAVHFARRAMGSDHAIATTSELMLWPDGRLDVDVDKFEEAAGPVLATGDGEAARRTAELYRGELLPTDRYEPWTEEPRERLVQRYGRVLKVAGLWERVLELDRADEEAHRAIMQRHISEGRRTDAIRQFDRLRRGLREELGVAPDSATIALYEEILGTDGPEPPTPVERAQASLAWALVHWNKRELDDAERHAREALTLALAAEMGHELGEASTLLALISYARGTWREVFREEFSSTMNEGPALALALYDAHLCFAEYYMYGPEGPDGAERYARELLSMAMSAGSNAGEAMARLLLGEILLLKGSMEGAETELLLAKEMYAAVGSLSGQSISLERLAEIEIQRGRLPEANRLMQSALPLAERSGIPTHLVVRVFGVMIAAAATPDDASRIVATAKDRLGGMRVCQPCSMGYLISAGIASARAGDLQAAGSFVDEAERTAGMWQGGPWTAATWEARAEMRMAEGEPERAAALFREAADLFASVSRPLDEARCRSAARILVQPPQSAV